MTFEATQFAPAATRSSRSRVDPLFGSVLFLSIWGLADDVGYSAWLEGGRYVLYSVVIAVFLARHTIFKRSGSLFPAGMLSFWLLALLGYWAISALWSEDIIFSLQRSILLATTALAAACAVANLDKRTISATLVTVLLFYVLGGAIAALLVPSIGLESSYEHVGRWRGIVTQKNSFGLISVLSVIVMLSGRQNLPNWLAKSLGLRLLLIGVSLACLHMTESRGALVALAVGLSAVAFTRLDVRYQRYTFAFLAVLLPVVLLLVLSSLSIDQGAISVLGLDLDTNNRIAIWTYAFNEWVGREILGTGFGGFWTGARINAFHAAYGWVLPNFHNGYISIVVETGILGGALFVGLMTATMHHIATRIGHIVGNGADLFVALIFLTLAHNAFENSLSRSTNILLLIFLISIFAVGTYSRPTTDKTG